ncbi:MerR family transcriptional regulator [Bacteriovoracaceae bacterium]|nr:MerR family transcriptional regulator [Bacteriovoracaceae bacterium]
MSKKFGIKALANLCNLKPHTIRTWEQRYEVFKPSRSEGGQRLYDEDDVAKAIKIVKLINSGHTISNLAKLNSDQLKKMFENCKDSEKPIDPIQNIETNLMNLLSLYEIDKIARELQQFRINLSTRDFVFGIVLPTMQKIGDLVFRKKYTVTQEHLISNLIRDQLTEVGLCTGSKEREMILATPEGNLHELSIMIADVLCHANSIPTRFLGASHPAESLAEAINVLKSPYLVLGAVSSDQWNFSNSINEYLSLLHENLDRPVDIILGGGDDVELGRFSKFRTINIFSNFNEFDKFLSLINL